MKEERLVGEITQRGYACPACGNVDMVLNVLTTDDGLEYVVAPVDQIMITIAQSTGHAIREHTLGLKPDTRRIDTHETQTEFVERMRRQGGN